MKKQIKHMRWLFFVLLALSLVIGGCGQNNGIDGREPADQGQSGEKPTSPKPNDDPKSEGDPKSEDEPKSEVDPKTAVLTVANEILSAIKDKHYASLYQYVHPEKGVIFSPYSFIQDDALSFSQEQVMNFGKDDATYTWGIHDGSGEPIELTVTQYFEAFVYNKDYASSSEVVYNEHKQRGNTVKNIQELHPNSVNVEYYVKGKEANGGMDWSSLILVFEKNDNDQYQLIAIVHDQWTI